jgi:hypothetical protein
MRKKIPQKIQRTNPICCNPKAGRVGLKKSDGSIKINYGRGRDIVG